MLSYPFLFHIFEGIWTHPLFEFRIAAHSIFELILLFERPSLEYLKFVFSVQSFKTIHWIIPDLELTFEAERPPPPRVVQQELLRAAEESGEYF